MSVLDYYYIESTKDERIDIQIINHINEKKLNIDLNYKKLNLKGLNFTKKLNPIRLSDQYFQRGTISIPNIVLTSIYPFGIITTKRYFHIKSKIIVFPKKMQPSINLLNEFNINLKGQAYDEFEGIEDYKKVAPSICKDYLIDGLSQIWKD